MRVRTIANPSQNETKLILLLSVVIVLLLTIPVSSSKLDRVEPKKIGFLLGLFFVVNQVRFGVANRRFTVDDGAPDVEK